MRDSIDEDLSRDAYADYEAESPEAGLANPNFDGQAGTRVEPAPTPFDIRRVDHPLAVVFALSGELDAAAAPHLQEALESTTQGSATVVIDLSGLRFIDSSGLQVLVRAERALRDWDGRLVLIHGRRAVRRVFDLTDLTRYFEWSHSVGAALRIAPRSAERRPDRADLTSGLRAP